MIMTEMSINSGYLITIKVGNEKENPHSFAANKSSSKRDKPVINSKSLEIK